MFKCTSVLYKNSKNLSQYLPWYKNGAFIRLTKIRNTSIAGGEGGGGWSLFNLFRCLYIQRFSICVVPDFDRSTSIPQGEDKRGKQGIHCTSIYNCTLEACSLMSGLSTEEPWSSPNFACTYSPDKGGTPVETPFAENTKESCWHSWRSNYPHKYPGFNQRLELHHMHH